MNQNEKDANFSQKAEEELAERAVDAIARKNVEFVLAHQNDTPEQLKEILRQSAKKLGHTPTRTELIGGDFIDFRFGTWKNAVEGVGEWKSSMEFYPKPLENTQLYQDELRSQRKKRRAEKRAKAKTDKS